MQKLPPEIICYIADYTTSPGILASTCSTINCIITSKKIQVEELVSNTKLELQDIYPKVLWLCRNAPVDIIYQSVQYATQINNYNFIRAFRALCYNNENHNINRVICEKYMTKGALYGGNIHMIYQRPSYREINRCHVDKIVKYGKLGSLKYLHEINPFILNKYLISNAAYYGHLHIIKWAKQHGCEWNEFATSKAAETGKLQTLRWLILHGCPYNQFILMSAIETKQLHIINFVIRDCLAIFNTSCVSKVIMQNDLKFLKGVANISPSILNPVSYYMKNDLVLNPDLLEYLNNHGIIINYLN